MKFLITSVFFYLQNFKLLYNLQFWRQYECETSDTFVTLLWKRMRRSYTCRHIRFFAVKKNSKASPLIKEKLEKNFLKYN